MRIYILLEFLENNLKGKGNRVNTRLLNSVKFHFLLHYTLQYPDSW